MGRPSLHAISNVSESGAPFVHPSFGAWRRAHRPAAACRAAPL